MGCQLREYDWPDYWYIGAERRMLAPGEKARSQHLTRLPEPPLGSAQLAACLCLSSAGTCAAHPLGLASPDG